MMKNRGRKNITYCAAFACALTLLSACSENTENSGGSGDSGSGDNSGSGDDGRDDNQGGGNTSSGDGLAVFNRSRLPDAYSINDDDSSLLRGKEAMDDFYKLDELKSLYLYFDSEDWFVKLEQARENGEKVSADLLYDGTRYEDVGVHFKGFTSYYDADKRKSFAIKLDETHEDQTINGYGSLNLNNSSTDQTYVREVFYNHSIRPHAPAPAANFVNLYVNDKFWGLYNSVQQLDKKFLRYWYANDNGSNWRAWVKDEQGTTGGTGQTGDTDNQGGEDGTICENLENCAPLDLTGDGKQALLYLGEDVEEYKKYYSLLSSGELTEPFTHLVDATRELSTVTADNLAQVNETLNIDGSLWMLAHEILFNDQDGYISKGGMDYNIYYDEKSGQVTPYERDGNEVLSNEYGVFDIMERKDDALTPLASKLFAIPELKQRYLAHARTMLKQSFDPEHSSAILDDFRSMVDQGVADDPHPHAGFSYAGLDNAFDEVKEFIRMRYEMLDNHAELSATSPEISEAKHASGGVEGRRPMANEAVMITAAVSHTNGLSAVNAYYGTGLAGTFTKLSMVDDGTGMDKSANDGVFTATLPGHSAGVMIRWYVEAVAADDANTMSFSPPGAEHDVFVFRVALTSEADSPVVINEVMARNADTISDEAGEFEDWVELYNTGDEAVDLEGYHLTDNIDNRMKWTFPDVSIPARGYLLVWLDSDEEDGELHANFKLDKKGEDMVLLNADAKILDGITLAKHEDNESVGRLPDGSGDFMILKPTPAAANAR